MEFWNNKVNVSKDAAKLQVQIIQSFEPSKRFQIALDFANMGVNQTRNWIKKNNPTFSDLEVSLEFVNQMYYKTGEISKNDWEFFKKKMDQRIKKRWKARFRQMMKENDWGYDDVAKLGNFKNGKVIEATISRGLPSFAKLAVMIHEKSQKLEE